MTPAQMRQASQTAGPVISPVGAVGDGVADDTTAIQAAVTAAGVGGHIFVPKPAVAYRLTAPILLLDGQTFRGGIFSQAADFRSVLVAWNVDDVTIDDVEGIYVGSKVNPLSGGHGYGANRYAETAVVLTNGNRVHVSNIRSTDFFVGVRFTAYTGSVWTKRSYDCSLDGLTVDGADFGLLASGVNRSTFSNIHATNIVDSTAGANPPHAIYFTDESVLNSGSPSEEITVDNVVVDDCLAGSAVQFKGVVGGVATNIAVGESVAVLSVLQCSDIELGGITGREISTGAGVAGVYIENVSRLSLSDVRLQVVSASPRRALAIIGNDIALSDIAISYPQIATPADDPIVLGAAATGTANYVVDGLSLVNTGSVAGVGIRIRNIDGLRIDHAISGITTKTATVGTVTNAVVVDLLAQPLRFLQNNGAIVLPDSVAALPAPTGAQVVAIGRNAGLALTTAASTTLVGSGAGQAITTANSNTAVGTSALQTNVSGASSTAVGANAARLFTGTAITAVGTQAAENASTATGTTAVGLNAARATTTGSNNTAVGSEALVAEASGTGNTAVGRAALAVSNGGVSNTALGESAGRDITTGDRNVFVGQDADAGSGTVSDGVAIGQLAVVAHDNAVALGRGTTTTATFQVEIGPRHIEADELASDPAAPATNSGRLYFRDNGAGKTQLCVRFATGAVQVIATEP
jgi:hypothetical protein